MARASMFTAWYHLLTNPFRSRRRRHSLPLTSLDPRRGRTSGAWTSSGKAQKRLSSSSNDSQPPLLPTKLIMPSAEILTPPVSPTKQHERWLNQGNIDADAAPHSLNPVIVHPIDVVVGTQAASAETPRVPPPRPPRSPVPEAASDTPLPASKPPPSEAHRRTKSSPWGRSVYAGPTHLGIGSVQAIVDPGSVRPIMRPTTESVLAASPSASVSSLARSVSAASSAGGKGGLARTGSKRGNPLAMNPVEDSEGVGEGKRGGSEDDGMV